MNLFENAVYIGAVYVGLSLSLGLIASLFIYTQFEKLKKSFFVTRPKEVPWTLIDVARVFLVYFGLQVAFSLFGLVFGKAGLISEGVLHYVALFWATLGVNVVILIYLLAFFQKKYRIDWEDFGLYKERLKNYIGLGALGYLGFIPIFFILVFLSATLCSIFGFEPKPHVIIDIFKEEKSIFVLASLAIFAAIIGPIFEEILFRGVLYPALRKKIGRNRALAITSIFFAVIHFNVFQFIPILGLGFVLTLLYEKTNNLIPSITLHALNNSVSVILTFTLLYWGQ